MDSPVSGAWPIVFDDLIPDDGGLVREVGLFLLAAKPSFLDSTKTFDYYDPDLADAVLDRTKHRNPAPPPHDAHPVRLPVPVDCP